LGYRETLTAADREYRIVPSFCVWLALEQIDKQSVLRLAEPTSSSDDGSALPDDAAVTAASTDAESCPAAASTDAERCPAVSKDEQLVATVLGQRYQLQSIIAQGSIGTIFKATDLTKSEAVAVKILFDTIGDACVRQQISQATEEICRFSHANVLPVLDLGSTIDDRPFFVSQHFEGLTLSQCIDDQQSLSEDDILDIFPQIADALASLHDNHVVYRGLQPSNIMLSPGSSDEVKVVLLDYAIAKLLNGPLAGALHQAGELFVSPLYISPEQCTEKTIGPQADVYSLGCVMYEAITGTAPHAGDTFAEITNKHLNEKPPSISDCNLKHHIPQSLIRIVEKAMEKDLAKRFQSMRELRSELNRHKMGMTLRKIPQPPPPPPMEKRKMRRRSRFNKPIPIAMFTLLFFLIAAALMISEIWISARTAPRLPGHQAPLDNIFPQ